MNYVRKVLSSLGGIFLTALLIAALAPKAARGVAAALVQVVNPTLNPVNVSESQANVFVATCDSISRAVAGNSCSISVPAGKRFVVQTVSFLAQTNPGVRVTFAELKANVNGVSSFLEFAVPFSANDGAFDNSVASGEVRFYADGNNSGQLGCILNFSNVTNGDIVCRAVGYLVDAP